jgi:DNA-binding SARP family transcriptional activator
MLPLAAVSLPFRILPAQEGPNSRGGRVASLRFELLGEVRALRDGLEVDLGPAKQRAVLAVLLLNAGRSVPTNRIVDAVWGDDPPENGANVVQKYVAGLRRVLDPDRPPRTPGELITLTAAGYQVNAGPDALDVAQFRADAGRAARERDAGHRAEAAALLSRALGLWRGPALAGLAGAVFESARDTLNEEHGTAWETWAEIELDRGEHAALVPVLVRLVAEFPLREGLPALLMLALHRTGRQAEALTVFQDARRYLRDEFGVGPGARLQEAHRSVLRGEPEAMPPDPPASVSPAPVSPASNPPAPTPPVSGPPAPTPPVSGPPAPRSWEQPWEPPLPQAWVPPAAAPNPPARKGRRYSLGEVIFAGLTPILLCSVGSWIYFVVIAIRRRDVRQVFVAAGYLCTFIALFATVGESTEETPAETLGVLGMLVLALTASLHGIIVASRPGQTPGQESLRAHARWIAASDPARALEIGIGRPDLPHEFDDGGLIDVNHVPGYELSRLRGLDADTAHRIVMDRHQRGPYRRIEDLVIRGLLTPAQLHRLGPRLICVPGALNPAVDYPPR